nr:AAA family ATPase [Sinorhizobium meliloti]
MANRAVWLARQRSHQIARRVLAQTFERHDLLSGEQKSAIGHIAGDARIAAVVGRAGAGKTTMMKAAREAWEWPATALSVPHLPARPPRSGEGSGHRVANAVGVAAAMGPGPRHSR